MTTEEIPLYLLTDPDRRDIAAWNMWKVNHLPTRADLRYADLRYADLRYADLRGADLRYADLRYADLGGADLRGADLRYAVGARRADICAAVPVGSGELCSAYRDAETGAVTIWAGCETFETFDACRARIVELGGDLEADRTAWLDWVIARLTPKELT
jgi:hypothetical protein